MSRKFCQQVENPTKMFQTYELVDENMKKELAGGIGVFLVAALNSDSRRGLGSWPSEKLNSF